jgi:hypothetical protein
VVFYGENYYGAGVTTDPTAAPPSTTPQILSAAQNAEKSPPSSPTGAIPVTGASPGLFQVHTKSDRAVPWKLTQTIRRTKHTWLETRDNCLSDAATESCCVKNVVMQCDKNVHLSHRLVPVSWQPAATLPPALAWS